MHGAILAQWILARLPVVPVGAVRVPTLEAELGESLEWFIKPAFHERGTVDFVIRSVACSPAQQSKWTCDIVVANVGNIPVPAELELQLTDGTNHTRQLKRGRFWWRVSATLPAPVTRAIVDPRRELPLNRGLKTSRIHVQRNTKAATRAAAHSVPWTQTVLQAVGL